jgi:hypothetical protein
MGIGCQGQHRVRLRDVAGCRRGAQRFAVIWLLASVLAVLGTADTSAARHKHSSPHRKKAVGAEQHKHPIEKSADEQARRTQARSPHQAAIRW